MASITPYLTFTDTCEAAFNFYRSVFGGEFVQVVRFKDMPSEHTPESAANLIAHISLPIGGGTLLLGSDAPEGFGPPISAGNNFSLSLNAQSKEEATTLFNGLSAGGNIIMPLGISPWGSFFGMWQDQFGINWMVSYEMENK